MGEKRGRPPKEKSKNSRFEVRMTPEQMAQLDRLSTETGETKTDVLMKALDIYYKMKTF